MPSNQPAQPNPYAAPLANETPCAPAVLVGTEEQRLIRRQRKGVESGLRQNTLGLVGVYVMLSAVAILSTLGWSAGRPAVVNYVSAILLTSAALAGLIVLWGVSRSAAWVRLPLTILSLSGLLLFPLGTPFAALILITLYMRAKPRVLSKEYEKIVRATPEMNARMSVMGYVAAVLLVVLGISIFLVAQIPPEYRHMRSPDR